MFFIQIRPPIDLTIIGWNGLSGGDKSKISIGLESIKILVLWSGFIKNKTLVILFSLSDEDGIFCFGIIETVDIINNFLVTIIV